MFFSLKPSPSQGESSLKISGHQDSPFVGVREQTNTLTDRLTDIHALIERCMYAVKRKKTKENNLNTDCKKTILDMYLDI